MLPHQESQVMPQYTNRLVKSQQLLPQQAVLCGGCSRHLPVGIDLNAGLQISKLINMGGKGATGCLHLQNFLHGINKIKPAYQEKNVTASLRNVNS